MKLYTYPASPGCRPIAMFIADHGIEVEQQVVDLMAGEQYQPAFAAINPNNAVPVLEDGSFRLAARLPGCRGSQHRRCNRRSTGRRC